MTESEMGKQQVDVTMVNINWLLADGHNFVDFVRILKDASSEQIYQAELLNILLEEFWEENFQQIFFKILVPWACYMMCMTWFYMTVLVDGYSDGDFED